MYVHTFWAVVTINILVCACYQNTEVSPHTHTSTPQRQLSSTACKEDCFLGRLWLSQVRHCLALSGNLRSAGQRFGHNVCYLCCVCSWSIVGFFFFVTIKQYVPSHGLDECPTGHCSQDYEKNIFIYTFFLNLQANLKSLKIDRFIGLFMVSRQNNAQLTVYNMDAE